MQRTWKPTAAGILDFIVAYGGLGGAFLEFVQGPNAGSIS
jgi:hypothetical protein